MRRFTKKQYVVAGVAAALIAGTAGSAIAYWSTSGSGTGSAATSAGTSNNLTFTQTALNPMFPGDTSQTLTVNVKNDGTETATVSNVKAYITTANTDCTGADFKLAGLATAIDANSAVAMTWAPVDLAASGGNANATSTVQFNNTAANQDVCKSAVVTIHYLAS
jgi:hypothetical protein